jgi:hypothetical protein
MFWIYYSVEDGRLRLEHLARLAVPDSQIYEFSCTVRIDRANKSDNGEWRAIIRSDDQINTYHEYSQVVMVLGKHNEKSLVVVIFNNVLSFLVILDLKN